MNRVKPSQQKPHSPVRPRCAVHFRAVIRLHPRARSIRARPFTPPRVRGVQPSVRVHAAVHPRQPRRPHHPRGALSAERANICKSRAPPSRVTRHRNALIPRGKRITRVTRSVTAGTLEEAWEARSFANTYTTSFAPFHQISFRNSARVYAYVCIYVSRHRAPQPRRGSA